MNEPYYTDAEMLQRMQQLTNEGKSLTAICNDPRCQPDVKAKLQQLEKLSGTEAINEVSKSFKQLLN